MKISLSFVSCVGELSVLKIVVLVLTVEEAKAIRKEGKHLYGPWMEVSRVPVEDGRKRLEVSRVPTSVPNLETGNGGKSFAELCKGQGWRTVMGKTNHRVTSGTQSVTGTASMGSGGSRFSALGSGVVEAADEEETPMDIIVNPQMEAKGGVFENKKDK